MDKINGAKNVLFFLSQAPTRYSFTFNLWFLHELKHKVRLSKTVCGIFHFRICSVFITFLYNKMTLKRHNSFKIKRIEKPHIVLLPDLWFLSCNKKFQNSMISAWVRAPQNWPGDKFFKPTKSKFWVRLSSIFVFLFLTELFP